MKKYIYIALVMVVALVVSCKSGDEVVNYDQPAGVAAEGTWTGTWMEISSYTGDTTYNEGTIKFEKVIKEIVKDTIQVTPELIIVKDTIYESYQSKVTISNPSSDWKTKSAITNIAHAGKSGDLSFNNDGTNGMGAAFTGRIYGDGGIIFSVALASKIIITPETGKPYKKNVIVAYSFDGEKQ